MLRNGKVKILRRDDGRIDRQTDFKKGDKQMGFDMQGPNFETISEIMCQTMSVNYDLSNEIVVYEAPSHRLETVRDHTGYLFLLFYTFHSTNITPTTIRIP